MTPAASPLPRRRKWEVFLSITFGYSFFYVCRLSLSVAKKPMLDSGAFDAGQLGLVGSALFFTYAAGKLVNGILADRVNVKRFMIGGLFACSLANLILGFGPAFWLFLVLWGLQGWFQSTGAPASVVSLAHWFAPRERGTYYSLWSTSHNIGEAVTFIATAVIVSASGWQWGFRAAGAAGIVMCGLLALFMHDRPGGADRRAGKKTGAGPMQWAVFKNPAIWCLALASALMYVTRYAVNSWGIFYLQAAKNYSAVNASGIVALGAIFGIAGTVASGIVSDRVFGGRRGAPAFLFALVLVAGLALFLFTPASPVIDSIAIALWGLAIGGLLVFLGGLMAVDLAGKQAMLAARGRVLVNLDKSYQYWAEARPILEETGTLRQIIIKGPVTAAKARRDIGPDIDRAIFMPVVDFSKPGVLEMLATYGDAAVAKAIELVFADDARLPPALAQKLRDARLRIWVNTLWPELCGGRDDDRAEADAAGAYDWLVARGATILQTDRPALLLAHLRARKLHD